MGKARGFLFRLVPRLRRGTIISLHPRVKTRGFRSLEIKNSLKQDINFLRLSK
jgi:hypothetical protein